MTPGLVLRALGWFGVKAITKKIKAILFGAVIALCFSAIVGAYLKGRWDCSSAVDLANARAAIEKLQKENALLLELADLASRQGTEFDDQERTNDEIGPALDDPSPTTCGLDAGWLSKLSQLR